MDTNASKRSQAPTTTKELQGEDVDWQMRALLEALAARAAELRARRKDES